MLKDIILCLFLHAMAVVVYGQVGMGMDNDALLYKLAVYGKSNPDDLLFLHTDKTLYTNNEKLWFSAYLVRSSVDVGAHTILSAALVREDDRSMYMREKFLLQDGLSFGNLNLPDTIQPGNYRMIAFTNVLGPDSLPIAVYTQPLTIESITLPGFTATISLLDTAVSAGAVRAKVNMVINNTKPNEKIKLTYRVGNNTSRTVREWAPRISFLENQNSR